jgi:hypothetical protein
MHCELVEREIMGKCIFIASSGKETLVGVDWKSNIEKGTLPESYNLPIVGWAIEEFADNLNTGEGLEYKVATPVTIEELPSNYKFAIHSSDGMLMLPNNCSFKSMAEFKDFIIEEYNLIK